MAGDMCCRGGGHEWRWACMRGRGHVWQGVCMAAKTTIAVGGMHPTGMHSCI